MRRFPRAVLLAAALLLGGCQRKAGNTAPPRVTDAAALPDQSSTIVVPVSAELAELATALNAGIPRKLWAIDQHKPDCVPAKRVDLGIAKLKVVPRLGCRIVGAVTRDRITLGGRGSTLTITMPVHATIQVRDLGGIIRQETASGAAIVRADARLGIGAGWTPTAKVAIAYDWTDPPGIEVLGQRITFVGKADEKLRGIIADLERQLPQELARMNLRGRLASVWARAFTTISLNRERPPAWMRVTPRQLGFGGYRVEGRRLQLTLAAEALTETFVGPRPEPRPAVPLPPPSPTIGPSGLRFFIPVLADYHELEPVVARALDRLAGKGISLTGVGPVDASFGAVTIYATNGGRLAVGIRAKVRKPGSSWTTTSGQIWLTALPYNEANSQLVRVRDLQIIGETDSTVANILFRLLADTSVQDTIRASLAHDFAPDYHKVLVAARKAIGGRREGDFLLAATVADVRNGAIQVTGKGLFLPVQAQGSATISYDPR